ncbi:hypothetical protein JCM11641_001650 [Rhodosporidiobolus odoratus]
MVTHAPPPTLLNETTLFSLASTVALLALALGLAKALLPARAYASNRERWTFVWLLFDGLIHFILEGAFVYLSFPRPRTVNSANSTLASLWHEYSLADTRWGVSDPTVVSVELITVLGAGPLAIWCCESLRRGEEGWKFWIVVLSVAELYGGWMTFVPEWISGSPSLNTSHWLYTWIYLFFFNGLLMNVHFVRATGDRWVAIPLVLIYQAYFDIMGALEEKRERMEARREGKKKA